MRDFVNSRVIERDPADPRPHHVPHERPADPLAVRLHEDRHPAGHVGRRPHHVRDDGQGDGRAATATRPSSRATSTSPTATRSTGCTASTGSSRSRGSSTRPRRRRSGATTTRPTRTIAPQTARNRGALLYFIDIGGCPYRAIGKEQTHCGPFNDDFEIYRGWRLEPVRHRHGDRRRRGRRRDPGPTSFGGHPMQLGRRYVRAAGDGHGRAGRDGSANAVRPRRRHDDDPVRPDRAAGRRSAR